jgi:hypothetical protein
MSDEVITALISGLCVAVPNLVALLVQSKKTDLKLDDNEKSNIAMKSSMIILLRSQIVSKCEKYQELGYLPDYARSCICDLFTQYTRLGGNHGVEVLVDEILKLPAKRKEG